ncbi:MAG: asparagine synthetase B [Saprospiraceae bacterium]|nr:asparagine synthetase B [Saprospiraceae bacterium]MBK8484060.1 asparagine synthetase B [Saprospiraceae bacterium]MBK9721599.1 asparagine synthetase B [Saprospiraceae bacterium]MBK9728664.1 asparagine synthetase B [Saprospiraceae bacterium]
MAKYFVIIFMLFFTIHASFASYVLIPMDLKQSNHLKAYGIAYWIIDQKIEVYWLLNYRGGSFVFVNTKVFEKECITRGVSYEIISESEFLRIKTEIGNPEINEEVIKLEKAPKMAVYTPEFNEKGERIQPWDDAVTLALTYAEIPFDKIYDREIIHDLLPKYDWLHLHHEDFTGQYGRFYSGYHTQSWYIENQKRAENLSKELGFSKVSQCKLAVAKKIKEYVAGGGFMFAMCSATDSYDIALSADGLDICAVYYDNDGSDPNASSKLDFSKTLAFKDYTLKDNPIEYEFSTIDNTYDRQISAENDYFNLFDFSAKWDPVPTMLTQNHTRTIKGFMGQTTGFKKNLIKTDVLVLGDTKSADEVRYIHGSFGFGTWTFYGGHDPEDYQHRVGDPPTDLNLHPNSPGYRLILNNVLFPAAKKKERKT